MRRTLGLIGLAGSVCAGGRERVDRNGVAPLHQRSRTPVGAALAEIPEYVVLAVQPRPNLRTGIVPFRMRPGCISTGRRIFERASDSRALFRSDRSGMRPIMRPCGHLPPW